LAWLFKIISILSALVELWRRAQALLEERRVRKVKEREAAREQALKDLENAKSEKEFDEAQDRVVDNKPS